MTNRGCDECDMEPQAHDALGEVLREGGLDVFARADLAADAIDLAESDARARTPRLHVGRIVLGAAAVMLLALGLFALLGDGGSSRDEQPPLQPAGDIAAEREANLAFLHSPETKTKLAALPKGTWVGIQGGDTLLTSDQLGKLHVALQKAARKARIRPAHRFTFRKGSEGKRAYDTNFNSAPFVGAPFMSALDLSFSAIGDQMAYHIGNPVPGGKRLTVKREPGKGATIPLYVGEPGSFGAVRNVYGFSTGSNAPLVLPPGMAFPLFEIPGEATLARMTQSLGRFRRYAASLSIPELGLNEVFVEAIGNSPSLEQADGSLLLGKQVWPPYTNEVGAQAVAEGKPVLLLERPRWLASYPGNPFAGLPADGLAAALPHYALAWREIEKPDTWVGADDEAPPTQSRLTVVDPRQSNRVLRQLVIRPWTRQARVAALLALGQREYEASPPANGALSTSERMAVRILRDIARVQKQFQARAHVDADHDGKGEYGTLRELTGVDALRMKEKLAPPLLPISYAPKGQDKDVVLEGYRIRLFLPGRNRFPKGLIRTGGGSPELGRLFADAVAWAAITTPARDSKNVDVDECETHWWAYAWPERIGAGARRTFYVDQDGTVWSTEPYAGVYEGTTLPPAYDAAFAGPRRVPGGVSPALVSTDGNRWREVPE